MTSVMTGHREDNLKPILGNSRKAPLSRQLVGWSRKAKGLSQSEIPSSSPFLQRRDGVMKTVKPPLPSADKRWKIIDTKMRKMGYKPHALIEALHAVQESFGFLDTPALMWVAKSLQLPPSKVYGVATFYNFFTLKPQGEHVCVVCLGTACYVKGASKVLSAIEDFAGIQSGETTPDKKLSLLTARCIGACAIAPTIVLDGNVAAQMSPEQAVQKVKESLTHAS